MLHPFLTFSSIFSSAHRQFFSQSFLFSNQRHFLDRDGFWNFGCRRRSSSSPPFSEAPFPCKGCVHNFSIYFFVLLICVCASFLLNAGPSVNSSWPPISSQRVWCVAKFHAFVSFPCVLCFFFHNSSPVFPLPPEVLGFLYAAFLLLRHAGCVGLLPVFLKAFSFD